ncbi:MAG: hypothetical protein QNJ16_17230 [Rhodobacter sp.]|nr:hypothetical protein [Rhodobacter sp.]
MAILQDYLDRMSDAVMGGDYAVYAAGVALPFTLVTAEDEITVETDAALRQGFDAYHEMLTMQNATDMIRIAKRAEPRGDGLVAGRYQTNILANGQRIFDAFDSDIVLRAAPSGWRAVWISNDMRNARWPIHLPFLSRPRPTPTGET